MKCDDNQYWLESLKKCVDKPLCKEEECPSGQHCNKVKNTCESCADNEHWNNSICVRCTLNQ